MPDTRATRRVHHLGVAAVAALVFVPVFAGCGTSNDNQTATTAPSTTHTTTPSTSSTTPSTAATGLTTTTATTTATIDDGGIDPMDGADTAAKSAPDPFSGTALFSAVRVVRQEGYDRVVFEFTNHVPGYTVRYVPKPMHTDGSGEEVAMEGNYALQVHMAPASGNDLTATGEPGGYKPIYTGPKRINAGTPEVTEVVETGDFEAVLTWGIGTREQADFRVFSLIGPPRLVVDLRNH